MRRRDSDWRLVAGMAASALLHAGVVWTTVVGAERGWMAHSMPSLEQVAARVNLETIPPAQATPPPAPEPKPEPEPPVPEEQGIRLGIDESDAETETWIGVRPEEAGAAQGRESSIEQAAFARPAGAPDLPLITTPVPDLPPMPAPEAPRPGPMEPAEAPAPSEPLGLPPAPAAPERPLEEPPSEEPTPSEEAQPEQEARDEAPEPPVEDFTPVVTLAVPEAAEAQNAQEEVAPELELEPEVSRPEDAPPGVTAPSPPAMVPPPSQRGGVTSEQFSGEISDREAEATAIRNAIVVEPGKPAAGQGLQIKTIRPRWSHFTLLTAAPRDAVVRIGFNRLGKVEDVEFLQDTGRADVDRPLLDAIYNWTASGKELEKLAPVEEGKPAETVKLVFRLILRGR